MEVGSQRPKERGDAISALNTAIQTLNLAKDAPAINAPAKTVFGSVSVILSTIRDKLINRADCVELGLACADICTALERVLNGKRLNDLDTSVRVAINQLTTAVGEIERNIIKQGKRNVISRHLRAEADKEKVAAWRLDLDKILQVFNKALVIGTDPAASSVSHDVTNPHTIASGVQDDIVNTPAIVSNSHRNALKRHEDTCSQNRPPHASAPGDSPPPLPRSTHGTISDIRRNVGAIPEVQRDVTGIYAMVSAMHRTMAEGQEGSGGMNLSTQTTARGELPPPAPRACFGRGELIEKIVSLAEDLTPIALIGVGGIGKTSIALTVLHHDRIRQRFGDNRRFIRCDQFTTSCAHLLSRISKVTGAGIENPEDLASLRPFLSSREIFLVLDNAESILDPQGTDAQEIYAVVEELSQLENVCLCITSRISTIPPDCETLDIPTLSIEAARDAFYQVYKNGPERSDLVDNILDQLDFHALSITLLATVAHHSKWDVSRLTREWEQRRTGVLQTGHNKSLAAAIELSLASPMFQELGSDARELLGVVAFFPQGINENNLDWLFPAIRKRTDVFDKFCILSLTHRSDGFITMLAPLRDHLSPKDPKSSSLLCTTKESYFTRMSVTIDPNGPSFRETQWITSEDVNIEHLLDIFTAIDPDSGDVWVACANFTRHLRWHKQRSTTLQLKIERLPDNHSSKPECLFELSWLFYPTGSRAERKRLLTHALKLRRERGDDYGVAETLSRLSGINRMIGLPEEGIEQAKEGLEIYERLGDTIGQAECLEKLALSLSDEGQLDAAEEAMLRGIALLPDKGQEYRLCESHQTLAKIYRSKGEIENAIRHFEVALGIASSFNWPSCLFWIHYKLAGMFRDQGRFDDTQAHLERAKLHTVHDAYNLGLAMELQAGAWYEQGRLEEARTEALGAADVYEKLGAASDLEDCRELLWEIENSLAASSRSVLNSQGTE